MEGLLARLLALRTGRWLYRSRLFLLRTIAAAVLANRDAPVADAGDAAAWFAMVT